MQVATAIGAADAAEAYGAFQERALPTRRQVAFLPLHVATMSLTVIAALSAITLRLHDHPASHEPIAIATGLGIVALIVYLRYFIGLRWVSAPVVYLLLFWMFHCGMTFTAAVMPSVLEPLADWEIEWFYWPNVRVAMALSVIGAAGFAFGVGLLGTEYKHHRDTPDEESDLALYAVGWLIMVLGLIALIGILATNGGVGLLSMSYLEFRATVLEPTMLQSAMDYSHLGCLLIICGARDRKWVKPLVLWAIFSGLPMLLLGMRGEAMIPLVSFFVVLTHRGVRFSRRAIVTAVLIASIVTPAIRTFRSVGFANRSQVNWTDIAPLETVTELGGSLRAVKAYVDWIERGDEYLVGASYWAPFDRQVLVRVMPDRERIPWEQDTRVPLRLMDEREGAVGGSTVGEAYYNFGPIGPFLFLTCVGVLFGWLERRGAATPSGCALLGLMMLLFIPNIRGDFLAIPAQVAQAIAILAACRLLRQLLIVREGRV